MLSQKKRTVIAWKPSVRAPHASSSDSTTTEAGLLHARDLVTCLRESQRSGAIHSKWHWGSGHQLPFNLSGHLTTPVRGKQLCLKYKATTREGRRAGEATAHVLPRVAQARSPARPEAFEHAVQPAAAASSQRL